jgi:hypothetical protein
VSLTKVLPACNNCYAVLCNTPDGQPVHIDGCEVCTCWEISNNNLLSYTPPEHYPPEMVPPSGKIHPYRMSFDTFSSVGKWPTTTLCQHSGAHNQQDPTSEPPVCLSMQLNRSFFMPTTFIHSCFWKNTRQINPQHTNQF